MIFHSHNGLNISPHIILIITIIILIRITTIITTLTHHQSTTTEALISIQQMAFKTLLIIITSSTTKTKITLVPHLILHSTQQTIFNKLRHSTQTIIIINTLSTMLPICNQSPTTKSNQINLSNAINKSIIPHHLKNNYKNNNKLLPLIIPTDIPVMVMMLVTMVMILIVIVIAVMYIKGQCYVRTKDKGGMAIITKCCFCCS